LSGSVLPPGRAIFEALTVTARSDMPADARKMSVIVSCFWHGSGTPKSRWVIVWVVVLAARPLKIYK
jgi:hypothetical protein